MDNLERNTYGDIVEYIFNPEAQAHYRRLYEGLLDILADSICADKIIPEFSKHSSAESLSRKMLNCYEAFNVYVVCDYLKDQYIFCAVTYDVISPHVDGEIAEIALLVSNMDNPRHLGRLMGRIKQACRKEGKEWLVVHKHVAPYEYRARYYKL